MVRYNTQTHSDVKWVWAPAKVVMCETYIGAGFQFFPCINHNTTYMRVFVCKTRIFHCKIPIDMTYLQALHTSTVAIIR